MNNLVNTYTVIPHFSTATGVMSGRPAAGFCRRIIIGRKKRVQQRLLILAQVCSLAMCLSVLVSLVTLMIIKKPGNTCWQLS